MNLSKRKAILIFEEHKKAELSGNDTIAKQTEEQLNNGGWKITYNNGWTIEKVKAENDILNSLLGEDEQAPNYLPRQRPVHPKNTDSDGLGTKGYILIGIGTLILIAGIIYLIRFLKRIKNA